MLSFSVCLFYCFIAFHFFLSDIWSCSRVVVDQWKIAFFDSTWCFTNCKRGERSHAINMHSVFLLLCWQYHSSLSVKNVWISFIPTYVFEKKWNLSYDIATYIFSSNLPITRSMKAQVFSVLYIWVFGLGNGFYWRSRRRRRWLFWASKYYERT